MLRPSVDLGKLAGEYEPRLPRSFRFLTARARHTRDEEPRLAVDGACSSREYLEHLIAHRRVGRRGAQARSSRRSSPGSACRRWTSRGSGGCRSGNHPSSRAHCAESHRRARPRGPRGSGRLSYRDDHPARARPRARAAPRRQHAPAPHPRACRTRADRAAGDPRRCLSAVGPGLADRELARGRAIGASRASPAGDARRAGRPAMLVVANLDGPRVFASALALYEAEELARRAARATRRVQALLAATTLYVVPRANPDAAEARFRDSARRGATPRGAGVDDDRDGREGEDAPADVDGDGLRHVDARARSRRASGSRTRRTRARWSRPTARRASAGAGSSGREGRDADGDERVGRGPAARHDRSNRNFPRRLGGARPRTRAVPDRRAGGARAGRLRPAHPDIALVVTYGALDNLVEKPKARRRRTRRAQKRIPPPGFLEADAKMLEELGRRYRESVGSRAQGRGRRRGHVPGLGATQQRGLVDARDRGPGRSRSTSRREGREPARPRREPSGGRGAGAGPAGADARPGERTEAKAAARARTTSAEARPTTPSGCAGSTRRREARASCRGARSSTPSSARSRSAASRPTRAIEPPASERAEHRAAKQLEFLISPGRAPGARAHRGRARAHRSAAACARSRRR